MGTINLVSITVSHTSNLKLCKGISCVIPDFRLSTDTARYFQYLRIRASGLICKIGQQWIVSNVAHSFTNHVQIGCVSTNTRSFTKCTFVCIQSKQFCDCSTDYLHGVGFCDDLLKRLCRNICNGAAKYLTFLLTRDAVFAVGSSLTRILFENLYASWFRKNRMRDNRLLNLRRHLLCDLFLANMSTVKFSVLHSRA